MCNKGYVYTRAFVRPEVAGGRRGGKGWSGAWSEQRGEPPHPAVPKRGEPDREPRASAARLQGRAQPSQVTGAGEAWRRGTGSRRTAAQGTAAPLQRSPGCTAQLLTAGHAHFPLGFYQQR